MVEPCGTDKLREPNPDLARSGLSNDERIRELRVDASRIADRELAISLDYSVGAGEAFRFFRAQ